MAETKKPSMLTAMELSEKLNPAVQKFMGSDEMGGSVLFGRFIEGEGYVVDFIPGKTSDGKDCSAAVAETNLNKITALLDTKQIGYNIVTDQNRCGGDPHKRVVTDVLNEGQVNELIVTLSKKKVSELSTDAATSLAAIRDDMQRQLAEAEQNGAAPAPASPPRSITV